MLKFSDVILRHSHNSIQGGCCSEFYCKNEQICQLKHWKTTRIDGEQTGKEDKSCHKKSFEDFGGIPCRKIDANTGQHSWWTAPRCFVFFLHKCEKRGWRHVQIGFHQIHQSLLEQTHQGETWNWHNSGPQIYQSQQNVQSCYSQNQEARQSCHCVKMCYWASRHGGQC